MVSLLAMECLNGMLIERHPQTADWLLAGAVGCYLSCSWLEVNMAGQLLTEL